MLKCNNFGNLAKGCQLSQDESNDICGITLYAQKEEYKWYIDSGCTKHMTGNKKKIITLKKEEGGDASFGDDGIAKILGKGTITLKGTTKAHNVLYVVLVLQETP